MIQTLDRSIYEKTGAKKYRQNGVQNAGICRFLSVSSVLHV